jgi:hypothetical protein
MTIEKQNCIRSSEKFWLEQPSDLFTNYNFIPKDSMSLGGKLNALFRVLFLIFLILLVFGYPYAIHFLLFGTVINVGYYYMYRNDY